MSDGLPETANLIGRDIAGYAILRRIGSGGMADVYLAEQKSLGRQIALKILHTQLAHDPKYIARFHREARAAASLVHPNIVQIYEVGEAGGFHFIAQEFVAGKSLDQLLQRQRFLEPALVLDVLRQVASALARAWEAGIVHRDIKPANILLAPSGIVKVADFGLAHVLSTDTNALTQVGVAMGTPLYMSPEQIEGKPVDVRSDIYSLGVTSYHLLAGEPPFTGETALAIAVQHLNKPAAMLAAVRADLPETLARTIHRMLSKNPVERQASPAELLVELKELAKQASAEGWAELPQATSLVEWIASDESRSQATAELAQLMRQESQLEPVFDRQRLLRWSFAAALAGALLAFAIPNRFILRSDQQAPIPVRDSPGAQLYHARMSDSEDAWRAVWENFPTADPFYEQLARQGLVRHYLFVTQEYGKAIPVLRELTDRAPSSDSLRSFILAAECVVHEQLGHRREAVEAYARLTPELKDSLNRNESQLYEMLETSHSRLE